MNVHLIVPPALDPDGPVCGNVGLAALTQPTCPVCLAALEDATRLLAQRDPELWHRQVAALLLALSMAQDETPSVE